MSSNPTCADLPDLEHVDRLVVNYARDKGWSVISSMFTKAAKEKVVVSGGGDGNEFDSTVTNILEFLGAHRKILIDYMISALKGGRSSMIQADAFGSTKPTSDYDLTIIGPGSYLVVRCMVDKFFEWKQSTMSFVFDSNLYIGPDVIMTPVNRARFEELGIRAVEMGNRAVPFPDTDELVDLEKRRIRAKLGKHDADLDGDGILRRYHELTDMGKVMDDFVYGTAASPTTFATKLAFFEHLYRMNELAIEGYHGLSTILFVVHGMQAGRMDLVRPLMTDSHLRNVALENVIDLTNHWNGAMHHSSATKDAVALKVKKYMLRILEALPGEQMKHAKQAVSSIEDGARLRAFMGLGDGEIDPSTSKGLVGALYRDLVE
jgi:hypothetical protein